MPKNLSSLIVIVVLVVFIAPLALAQQDNSSHEDFGKVAARAEQARNENRIGEAIELYRRGLTLRPQWAEGWWYLGTLLYDQDAFADAAAAFGKAANYSPQIGTAWVMLGLCEFKLNRFDDALKHIQEGRRLGVSADPQFRQVMLYHEGVLLLGKGEFEQAQETLGRMSREGAENDDLTVALGLSVLRLRPSELLAGDAALRNRVERAGHAEHLAARKRFDEALTGYQRLANDFPKEPNIQYALGRYLLASNDVEGAVAAFQREIENNSLHLPAHLFLADSKLKLKDFVGGLPLAEKAVKLNPRLPLGHYLLGSFLLETGQTARAITELETAERLLPNEPKIHFALARAYARANRRADADRARAAFARLTKEADQLGGSDVKSPQDSSGAATPSTPRKP